MTLQAARNWQAIQQSITGINTNNKRASRSASIIPLYRWASRRKNGNYAGFDIELAKYVSKKLGITVHFQPIDWDMKETELQNGTIDAIWNGYSATDERREKVAFTIPYMQKYANLSGEETSGIHSVEDMTGKSLAHKMGHQGCWILKNIQKC